MERYIIHASNGSYVKFIIFKNTARYKDANLLRILVVDRNVIDKDFVNSTFFFTNDKKDALVIKNKALANYFANTIDGYIEEIEV